MLLNLKYLNPLLNLLFINLLDLFWQGSIYHVIFAPLHGSYFIVSIIFNSIRVVDAPSLNLLNSQIVIFSSLKLYLTHSHLVLGRECHIIHT